MNTPEMTPELLKHLTADERAAWERCQRATDGPWAECRSVMAGMVDGDFFGYGIDSADERAEAIAYAVGDYSGIIKKQDARFIAHSRLDLPAALLALAQLRQKLAEAQEDTARMDWMLDKDGDGRVPHWVWTDAAQLCPVDWNDADNTRKWGRAAIDQARGKK